MKQDEALKAACSTPVLKCCHSNSACLYGSAKRGVLDFRIIVQIVMTLSNVCGRKLNSPFDPRKATQKKIKYFFYSSTITKHISSPFRGTNFCSSAAVLEAAVYIPG